MQVQGRAMRPLWPTEAGDALVVIDQRRLPHELVTRELRSARDVFVAIREMWVRGAPLIGAVAAYGLALQARRDATDGAMANTAQLLAQARPTAVNLAWALQRMQARLVPLPPADRAERAWAEAAALAEEDVAVNRAIGEHGFGLLQQAWQARRARDPEARALQVLTHCNAGWLATVDWGTATAPLYLAQQRGLPVHVWVDETRPRNQGAGLTAWELGQAGIAHTVVADNAGGHLMQHGQVDLCIVGCDRVTARGDACNKIGTYLKALAAQDNGVPFYVAMPTSTLDLAVSDGLREIPIEERSAREVTHVAGLGPRGDWVEVQVTPEGSAAANPAFDVTPARLITAFITEHGLARPEPAALQALDAAAAVAGTHHG